MESTINHWFNNTTRKALTGLIATATAALCFSYIDIIPVSIARQPKPTPIAEDILQGWMALTTALPAAVLIWGCAFLFCLTGRIFNTKLIAMRLAATALIGFWATAMLSHTPSGWLGLQDITLTMTTLVTAAGILAGWLIHRHEKAWQQQLQLKGRRNDPEYQD